MMYVVSVEEDDKGIIENFTLFETSTESYFKVSEKELKQLKTDNRIKVMNMKVENEKPVPAQWCNMHRQIKDTSYGPQYTLLCRTEEDKFKIVFYKDYVIYLSGEELRELIRENRITNCTIQNEEYKSTCTYTIGHGINFKKFIDEKYNSFAAKSSLMGLNMSFEYIVEGREVKIRRYTGKSKTVIIPNFITSIMIEAFEDSRITKLKLSEGLKSIGQRSFGNCDIGEVVIPNSVVFIGRRAFYGNEHLVNDSGDYKDTIKVLNPKTIISTKRSSSDLQID